MNKTAPSFNKLEKALLNNYQQQFPLCENPFSVIAEQLDVSEDEVIQTLKDLQNRGVISRIGPVFYPNKVGVSTLAAMAVDDNDIEKTAEIINRFSEVNHNYQREDDFNLWFVVTASDNTHLQNVLNQIEKATQYPLISLPMEEDYFIDLGFSLHWSHNNESTA